MLSDFQLEQIIESEILVSVRPPRDDMVMRIAKAVNAKAWRAGMEEAAQFCDARYQEFSEPEVKSLGADIREQIDLKKRLTAPQAVR